MHFFSLSQASPSRVLFQLIPSCLVPKEANEMRQKRCQTASAIVESVVRDVCHTLHQTGGVLGLIPRPISHVFNNNACRGRCVYGCCQGRPVDIVLSVVELRLLSPISIVAEKDYEFHIPFILGGPLFYPPESLSCC